MNEPPTSTSASATVSEPEKPLAAPAPPPLPAPETEAPPPARVRGTPFIIESLLLSGQRKRWPVGSEETVDQLRQRIFSEWPPEWSSSEPGITSPDSIRLLYLGRFLDPAALLSSYNLKPPEEEGQRPTIVHLHIRTLPSGSNPGGAFSRKHALNASL
ncbi:hypothetical protein JCM11491_005743 [Sporobolomyces phaffii]